MENGFQIDKNKFIAYQSISTIDKIKTKDEYTGFFDVVLRKYTNECAEKQVYFIITLLDGCAIKITVDNYMVQCAYTDGKPSKNIFSFLWWWLTHTDYDYWQKQKPSDGVKEWLDDDSNVKNIIEETINLRNEIISKFNKWKNYKK